MVFLWQEGGGGYSCRELCVYITRDVTIVPALRRSTRPRPGNTSATSPAGPLSSFTAVNDSRYVAVRPTVLFHEPVSEISAIPGLFTAVVVFLRSYRASASRLSREKTARKHISKVLAPRSWESSVQISRQDLIVRLHFVRTKVSIWFSHPWSSGL